MVHLLCADDGVEVARQEEEQHVATWSWLGGCVSQCWLRMAKPSKHTSMSLIRVLVLIVAKAWPGCSALGYGLGFGLVA